MQEITGPTAFTKCEKCGVSDWVKPDGTEMVDADFAENGYIRFGAILKCRNCGNEAALKNPRLDTTDIVLMVEIPTKGLNQEQAATRLKQIVTEFHARAFRRFADSGYSVKKVQLFVNDPSKCNILIKCMSSKEPLKLEEMLWDLWNQVVAELSGLSAESPPGNN